MQGDNTELERAVKMKMSCLLKKSRDLAPYLGFNSIRAIEPRKKKKECNFGLPYQKHHAHVKEEESPICFSSPALDWEVLFKRAWANQASSEASLAATECEEGAV